MTQHLRQALSAEWLSAAMVVVSSMAVGARAAQGLNPAQWLGAAAAILGSIAFAVMVRAWPKKRAA